MKPEKKPLYRKFNNRTYHADRYLPRDKDASKDRGTKNGVRKSMHSNLAWHTRDYTPLYMFLLKHVGDDFDAVFSEVKPRIEEEEPLWHMVAKCDLDISDKGYIRVFNSFYSQIYVDDEGKLQKVNPDLDIENFYPYCPCCTHTFNGVPFVNKFTEGKYLYVVDNLNEEEND